jgi:hypothetical protein
MDIGYRALERCFQDLGPEDRSDVGMLLAGLQNPKAIVPAHGIFVRCVRDDTYYNSFLQRHIAIVGQACRQDMAAYLLQPDRGPTHYNVDSFFLALKSLEVATPFVTRWREWIVQGRFDGGARREDNESAEILYKIFNEGIAKKVEAMTPLIEACETRVWSHCKSATDIRRGMYHLVSMLNAGYVRIPEFSARLIHRVYHWDYPEVDGDLCREIFNAMELWTRLHRGGGDESASRELQAELDAALWEIAAADRITGFYGGSKVERDRGGPSADF